MLEQKKSQYRGIELSTVSVGRSVDNKAEPVMVSPFPIQNSRLQRQKRWLYFLTDMAGPLILMLTAAEMDSFTAISCSLMAYGMKLVLTSIASSFG